MNNKIAKPLAAAVMLLCAVFFVYAQQQSENQPSSSTHHMRSGDNTETATGCLQKSSAGNGYTLASQDGGTWQLTSTQVDLEKYAGKQVSVAGNAPSSARHHGRRVANSQNAGNASGQNTMDVFDLIVLNEKCQQ